ncbi:MAG TPA: amino acid ABC transporter permease [Thermoplasmata archaeon]|nr:amino acid ABC transporter permease [Thermoplasmata archaeon]
MARHSRLFHVTDRIAAVVFTISATALAVYLVVGRWGVDETYLATRWPLYLEAAQVSLYYTSFAFAVGLVIGLFFGWTRAITTQPLRKILRDARRAHGPRFPVGPFIAYGTKYYLRRVGDGFVATIRGTPLFVQIMFAAAVLRIRFPQIDPLLIGVIAGLVALTLNTAGYQSEIFRAGFQTVHSGQVEAARAIGLSRSGAMRYVVLPQALRLVIPPLTNEYIGLLKVSSLLLVVGILELTGFGRREAFISAAVFESFALVTGIYLLLTVPISKVVSWIERKYRVPGLGIQAEATIRA